MKNEKEFYAPFLSVKKLDENQTEKLISWCQFGKQSIGYIQKSQKIHGGSVFDIEKLITTKGSIFKNELSLYAKTPYTLCWFDFFWNKSKLGILVNSLSKDFLCLFFFAKGNGEKIWGVRPVYALISVNKRFKDRDDFQFLEKLYSGIEGYKTGNVALFAVPKLASDIAPASMDEIWNWIKILEKLLILLNCKNIIAEKTLAPERLNKKRRKAGKQELFDYHVLNVVIPSKKKKSSEKAEPLSHNRVHLCRGHFKEYTIEKPLFGKLTGLYWWQPHVRGQNKKGIVIKDYVVNLKGE
ncbi:MAG: hypothetical protein ABIC68_04595 [Candidatus Omnitrophota bacterium]